MNNADLLYDAASFILTFACSLPIVIANFCVPGTFPRSLHAPATAFVAYVALFLPTSGMVQHGMLQWGGDRYTYLAYLPFFLLLSNASTMLLVSFEEEEERDVRVRIEKKEEEKAEKLSSSKEQANCLSNNKLKTNQLKILLPQASIITFFTLVILLFSKISSLSLCNWCDDGSMFMNNMIKDPTDWRVVDSYAEFIYRMQSFEDPKLINTDDELAFYLKRTLDYLPQQGVKSMMNHAKTHVLIGDTMKACDMYITWWNESANESERSSPLLINNVAICSLREGVAMKEQALSMLKDAFGRENCSDDTRAKIVVNHNLLLNWEGHGMFTGSVHW
jgi:hypothetical protein